MLAESFSTYDPKAAFRDDRSERPKWVDSGPSSRPPPTARLRRKRPFASREQGGMDRPTAVLVAVGQTEDDAANLNRTYSR